MSIDNYPNADDAIEQMIERRREKALHDMDTRTPKQCHLEIGTGGICAGYDPRFFADGDLVVTVDLLEGAGASAHHQKVANIDHVYEQRNEHLSKKFKIPEYKHDAVIGDGRDLSFFGDRKFREVLMCNIACDPGISLDDLSKLITAALEVTEEDGRLLLSEELSAFVARDRLSMTNFNEAGIEITPIEVSVDRVPVYVSPLFRPEMYMLTKTEQWGKVPVRFYDEEEWARVKFKEQGAAIEAARRARKQERKDKFAKSVIGRMLGRRGDV